MKHQLVNMTWLDTVPQKSRPTKTFKFGKNIWFKVYTCSICHARVEHLSNFHKPTPNCDGSRKPKNELIAANWRSHGWVG